MAPALAAGPPPTLPSITRTTRQAQARLTSAGSSRRGSGTATRTPRPQRLADGFIATGSGEDGAVHPRGAHIGGQLDCSGAELRNDSGLALAADSLQVDQALFFTNGFIATGGGADVVVDLTVARVSGALVFDPARLEHAADPHRRLAVDGLTYAGVPQRISARSITLNGSQHRHSKASCSRQAPNWQVSSERCHLVGRLNPKLAAFGRKCPVQLKVVRTLSSRARVAGCVWIAGRDGVQI